MSQDLQVSSRPHADPAVRKVILPDKFPPPTTLLDLQPLPLAALHNQEFEAIYSSTIENFNKIQTQVFQALYASNDNVFVGAPTGSGKTIAAEFALLRLWSQPKAARAVCIEPFQDVVDARVSEWKLKFGEVQGGKEIVALTGETSADIRLLEKADLVVCTPGQWDLLSRRWKQRKNVQTIGLLIADEIQLIGGEIGPAYEVIVSRTRYVAAQTENKTRIVAFGVSLANARDLGEWMGATSQTIFNFSPGARPLPMEVHIQSFNVPHFPSLMIQMAKPAYLAIVEYAEDRPVICFVPSRKQCRSTASDILIYCTADQEESRFLNIDAAELAPHLEHVSDPDLKITLASGIGFYHEALSKQDKRIIEHLFESGAIQVVVASKDTAWSIPLTAYMVIIMGVQTFEGPPSNCASRELWLTPSPACRQGAPLRRLPVHRRPPDDGPRLPPVARHEQPLRAHVPAGPQGLLQKVPQRGPPDRVAPPPRAARPLQRRDRHEDDREQAVRLLVAVVGALADPSTLCRDAVDWLTWTWMYRRLVANANYYNMQGPSRFSSSVEASILTPTSHRHDAPSPQRPSLGARRADPDRPSELEGHHRRGRE